MKINISSFTMLCAGLLISLSGATACAQLPADANTTCPVMSAEASDPKMFVEYKGRKIYVCCGKCKRTVRADPEKYLAMISTGAASSTSTVSMKTVGTTATKTAATSTKL
jgi:hypothetical protein